MRGKVDENMPIECAGVLRTGGWECDTVFDEALGGRDSVLALLRLLIPVLRTQWAEHRLWIVEPGCVRVREVGAPAV